MNKNIHNIEVSDYSLYKASQFMVLLRTEYEKYEVQRASCPKITDLSTAYKEYRAGEVRILVRGTADFCC